MTKITFNDQDMSVSQRIPQGVHEVFITKVEQTTTKRGDPMLKVIFKDTSKREEVGYFPLSEKGRFKVAHLCLAVGFTAEYLKANGLNPNDLLHKSLVMIKEKSGVRVVDGKEYIEYAYTYCTPEKAREEVIHSDEQVPF